MSGGGAGQFEPLELPQGTYKKLQIILLFYTCRGTAS